MLPVEDRVDGEVVLSEPAAGEWKAGAREVERRRVHCGVDSLDAVAATDVSAEVFDRGLPVARVGIGAVRGRERLTEER